LSGAPDSIDHANEFFAVGRISERERIEHALRLLSKDPFHATLHTHKLKGDMARSLACTVDFEYRIVFEFVPNPKTGEEEILLEAIGTHEEVY
jgi:mRNA-degrading endonuclease YafQ of YafQ-DinJ toxin-antitoxin module